MTDFAPDMGVTPDERARLDAVYAKLARKPEPPKPVAPLNRHLTARLATLEARTRRAA